MRTIAYAASAWVIAVTLSVCHAAPPLPRSTPESQGVSSPALLNLVNTLDQKLDGMHSIMILRHGHVIAEGWWKPYDARHNHVLYSLSKSFTSTAVGMAVAEGKITLDDRVTAFFPESVPANAGNNLKAMRVRDILSMSTGHQDEPPVSPDAMSVQSFLAQPVPHLPGTHFKYNTPATFMQSAIVQKVADQPVLDYLRPRLFEPLGISHPVWDTNFQGISLGGYGLRVRTEDIARFGQLYLQKGKWNGRQLLSPEWVEAATSKQVSNGSDPNNDWNQGYGYQFWRSRNGAYRGDGAFGQYCVVLPDQDAVVAITSGVRDMQEVLNLLWEKLLPAFGSRKMRANRAAHEQLKTKLQTLEVPLAQGGPSPGSVAGFLNRQFAFPTNDARIESLTLNSTDGGKSLSLTLVQEGRSMVYPCGFREWRQGRSGFPVGRLAQFRDEPVAGSFAWGPDGECVMKVCAYETPFHITFRLGFEGDRVRLNSESNVAFGQTKRQEIVGQTR